ncbi:MAG: prolipoprotein diacylglyceryl transferase [Patescibacteria group bacterium]|jgi:phosphatidylglycerol:prolipoprotein diacylglycerol transferase
MFHFLHTFTPTPIIAVVGPFTLYWYGLGYLVAIAAAYLLVNHALRRISSKEALYLTEHLPTFTVGLVVSGIIGARLYHVITQWSIYYSAHIDKIFAVNEGGLAIHGGLIGGLAFLWWYSKRIKRDDGNNSLLWLLDLIAPAVLLGQAIGRIGNYFNQELFGLPTNLPWGIPIALEHRPELFLNVTYFHPTFLYESLWDLVGFLVIYCWQKRLLQKNKLGTGLVVFPYLVWMGLGRILVELIRTEPAPLLWGVRLHQIISILIVLIGITGLATLFNKRRV